MLNIDALHQLETSHIELIQTTLQNTSLDDKNSECMVASTASAFDMDAAMRLYIKTLPKQDGCPRSVDALLCGKNGTDYLIEFKNGSVKKDEVLNKLYATLLMLQDVCELSVTDARKGLVFVLVYNGAKLGGQGANSSTPSKRVNDAPHFGLIRQGVTKHTGVNEKYAPRPVRGIGNSVKGIFVKDYIHCDKNDFEDILTDALS